MTKQGRKVAGIISILGGIYSIIRWTFNLPPNNYINLTLTFLIYIWIVASLGILGGILLLEDWNLGAGLSLVVGTMLLCSDLLGLIFSYRDDRFMYWFAGFNLLIGAGLIVAGGFIGVMIGAESHFSMEPSELDLIEEWIDTKELEMFKAYKVEKIEFFDRLWGGLVFSVEFSKKISPDPIKNLIGFLEQNWGGKIFIMTKTGLDETDLARDKYIIYQKEGGHLSYKVEQINLND